MSIRRVVSALVFCIASLTMQAQAPDAASTPLADTTRRIDNLGSLTIDTTRADTVRASGDIDTIVVFSAKDSVHFNVRTKRMRLRGDADVKFKDQRLQSEVVIMDFGTSTMYADGVRDSTGRLRGFPLFIDKGEEYAGERIVYNFKSRQGRVTLGETNVDGGFYWGNRIKRVSEKTIYVEDGNFTTCDAPHPHFHFNSPRMKVVIDDKLFYDPLILYVEDIPVFAMPIGLYFDMRKGRHSGIILPTPLITSNRGVVLNQGGYYWAASDYWEMDFLADVMSKGGFTLYNKTRYSVRDVLRGNIDLLYGYTRFNVTDGFTRNFGVTANHQQTLGPDERISATVLFTTSNLFQNTSFNPYERLQQNARSDVSYQRTFYNGHTLNAGYTRDQNMINGSITHSPTISYGIPVFAPITDFPLQLGYRTTGRYFYDARRNVDTTPFAVTERSVIEHRPTVSLTPKLGYITFQPSITYDENWYLQRYTQSVNPDSTIATTREPGFFREFRYAVGVSASTFLYGNARPNIWGITAFRHTVQPTISATFVPDQSDTSRGFFGTYTSPYTNEPVRYSRFGSGIASDRQQLNLGLNLLNRFAIKLAQGDTLPDKPLEILTVNASSAYNVVADSLRLAPINISLRSPVLDVIAFNSSFQFDIYDQARSVNPITGTPSYTRINRTTLEAGKGLARLTSMSFQFGSRFTSEGVSFQERVESEDTTAPMDSSGSKLRARFDRRVNYRPVDSDLYGDETPGWNPIVMPWEAEFNVSYTYNRTNPELSTESLRLTLRGSTSLSETLRLAASANVDLITGAINFPTIDISKRLHCWMLSVNWIPLGVNKGFFLRFAADASILQDMKITKQSTPLYR
ncbi:MAG: putative LPS assembly protein LptD [bacterium]|nr:putative LPS assembly protein LptD [bacterium]